MSLCSRCGVCNVLPGADFCWPCATQAERESWWKEGGFAYLEGLFSGVDWFEGFALADAELSEAGYRSGGIHSYELEDWENHLFLMNWLGANLRRARRNGKCLAFSRLDRVNLTRVLLKNVDLRWASLDEAREPDQGKP